MTLRISNSNIGHVECRIVMPRVVRLIVVLLSAMALGAEYSKIAILTTTKRNYRSCKLDIKRVNFANI